jgi:hypothetical protein
MLCACAVLAIAGWWVVRPEAMGAPDEPAATHPKSAQGVEQVDHGVPKAWTTAVDPKPLTGNVKKGLSWLLEHQLPSGGWGQGEEAPGMRGGGVEPLRDQPNVADTCVAALSLIRSGSTPTEGPYKDAIARAVRFVAGQVESSDTESLAVSGVTGTRVQQKLGPNIDTFLASLLLAEVKGKVAGADTQRVNLALDKVLDKIKRHQKEDGTFDGAGWAPVLAQAMCGKGINRAQQAGAMVAPVVLARAETSAKNAFAMSPAPAAGTVSGPATARSLAGGRAAVGAGAAGVELYDRAANLGVLQDSVNTNRSKLTELRDKADKSKDVKEREEAKREIVRIGEAEKVYDDAQKSVIERLGDKQFTDGFGSNGGEEFLSYMNISESLVVKGGNAWKQWDASITNNLNHVQNEDGSWTGHHCITGRTFCTSAALLVLMADRTPVPVESKGEGHAHAK